MRIVDIRETTVPLAATMANAAIDFSLMTASAVAVVTDPLVEGKADLFDVLRPLGEG